MKPAKVKRIAQKQSTGKYSAENPQNRNFWRILGKKEVDIFNNTPEKYGLPKPNFDNTNKPNISELLTCQKVKEQPCVRCRPCMEDLLMWESPGAMVLTIPVQLLAESEWETVPGKPDIYLVGAAAIREGRLLTVQQAKVLASAS